MNIKFVIALIALVILIIVCAVIESHMKQYCQDCGTKMDSFYDPDEDAEVYQCPKFGRSYLIKYF